MNQIIAASALADMLASTAGITRQQAESFIREYFATIHTALASGDDVHIKGLGNFILTADDTAPIRFEPSPDLKNVVNAPFEMFEPTALNPGDVIDPKPVTPPAAPCPPQPPVTEQERPVAPEPEPPEALGSEPPQVPEPEPPQLPEPEPPQVPEPEPPAAPSEPVSTFIPPVNPVDYGYSADDEPAEVSKNGFAHRHPWILALIALTIGMLVGGAIGLLLGLRTNLTNDCYVYMDDDDDETILVLGEDEADSTVETTDVVVVDDTVSVTGDSIEVAIVNETVSEPTADATPTRTAAAADDATYDTVSRTVFLTTLARRYYGQMEYWVYIYDANPGLGNPNSIKPGTRLLIPAKSDLPLTGNPEVDVAAAKQRSTEIYARYSGRK